MRRSIFDILDKDMNYEDEFDKLVEHFTEFDSVEYNKRSYPLADAFNEFIEEWEYRGTYTQLDEIMTDLGLTENGRFSQEVYIEKCLILIELILNIREFLLYKREKCDELVNYYIDTSNLGKIDSVPKILITDGILYKNTQIILNKLGYKAYKTEKYKVLLIKDNADAISTALIVEDRNVSDLIMSYNDFRIEKDIKAKKDILFSLGQHIEPLRKKIKVIDSSLEDYVFFCLNKLNIRHNNKSGKEKNDYVAKLSDKMLIKWYDNLYDLILIAIRLVELPDIYKNFKDLKDKIIAIKEEF